MYASRGAGSAEQQLNISPDKAIQGGLDRWAALADQPPHQQVAELQFQRALESTLADIGRTRQTAALSALHGFTSLVEGLLAFASRRYRYAERCYWQVLNTLPGHLEARAFLAETLILQRRTGEAQRVLAGLDRVRGDHPALAFAASLRKGFEVGLYEQLPAH